MHRRPLFLFSPAEQAFLDGLEGKETKRTPSEKNELKDSGQQGTISADPFGDALEQGDLSAEVSKLYDGDFSDYDLDALKWHIENPEASKSGKRGISGAHRKDGFMKEVNRIGGRIERIQPHPQIDGVEIIEYRMPQKDKYGNSTGGYRAKSFSKTVYDPSVMSIEEYIARGLQAANDAAKTAESGKPDHEWEGFDGQGIRWHGYCDGAGNITSFFPKE